MPYSNLIASNLNNNKRPDYANKNVEDLYFQQYANSEITLPLPKTSLARILHSLKAAKQAFVAFRPTTIPR